MATKRNFYQITLGPPSKEPLTESSPVLMLAPFSSVPKVDFNKIRVGVSTMKEVIIRNPTNNTVIIELIFTEDMIKRKFSFNDSIFELPATSQKILEIQWCPCGEGQWRDLVRVAHMNGRNKYAHISITSSAVSHRVPLRRILTQVNSTNTSQNLKRKSKKMNIKNYKFNDSCGTLNNQLRPSDVSSLSNNRQENEIKIASPVENFVVGKLPSSDLSHLEPRRSTYVKYPGFPLYKHNLPIVTDEEEIISEHNIHNKQQHETFLSKEIIKNPLGSVQELNEFNSSNVELSQLNEDEEEDVLERDSLDSHSLPRTPLQYERTPCTSERGQPFCFFTSSPVINRDAKKQKLNFNESYAKPFLLSSCKKRPKKENVLGCISSKSRVLFKKSPQKLTTPCKLNKSFSLLENQKHVEVSSIVQESTVQHPLGFYHEASYEDPFAKNALHTAAFLEKQTMELIKWLNSVLTPLKELSSIECGVNIEKLWKKSITSDVLLLAPTKDEVSTKYHSDEGRLMAVRKAASAIYRSENVAKVLHGVYTKVENGFLDVKNDLDLHCDQGARYKLVQLLMYYNPLWLRVGLETIYEQTIYVRSENFTAGLIYFLKKKFLSDDDIVKKNSYAKSKLYKLPNFRRTMNNFIVFKFLTIIFFLDQAKIKRIIPYDPCLFRKSAVIKESEEILKEFVKEFIKCVGAQRKILTTLGYCLNHKQTPLDEFDYSVSSYHDLRDGVRLARAMEIILKKGNLSQNLRTPVVSRLQKIHNVKITLTALRNEGFEITENITANDVVDGHYEKIMSLLWQILHRFLGPRFLHSAIVIQRWWRKILPLILIKNQRRCEAAIKLQTWWRGEMIRKRLPKIIEQLKKQRIIVQAAIKIQRWYRKIQRTKDERSNFLKLKNFTVIIQKRYRSLLSAKALYRAFQDKKKACIKLQQWYRSSKAMQKERDCYLKLKFHAVIIQRRYRATKLAKKERLEFLIKKKSCLILQRFFRGFLVTRMVRQQFLIKKYSACIIQRWYRKKLLNKLSQQNNEEQVDLNYKLQRLDFKEVKTVDVEFAPVKVITEEEKELLKKHAAASVIQGLFRGYIWRKKNTNLLALLKNKTAQIKPEITNYDDTEKNGSLRLVDLFDYAVEYFSKDLVNIKFNVLWITFKNLDYITLHSPILCKKLSQFENFFVISWETLNKQTRSDPYIDLFEYILNTLVNLARYSKTFQAVQKSLEKFKGHVILATLMGKSLGKHPSLFCKCVGLLWIVCSQDSHFVNVVKAEQGFKERLLYYYKQIARRPHKKKDRTRIVIPHLVSDWGYKKVNRDFLCDHAAISELFQVLKLSPPV